MTARTFIVDSRDRLAAFIKFLGKLDTAKPWQLTLEEYVGKRSLAQNRMLWSLHGLASEVTGYSKDDMHELMLAKHFGYTEIEFHGIKKCVPLKRSSMRNKKEFREFLDFTENFYACELGIWLGQNDET